MPEKATSDLLLAGNPDAILPLGDLQYENAKLTDFWASYDISWGRAPLAAKTYPVAGNHEYQTSGAAGYYQYWQQKTGQDAAHQATNGYYSFDLGAWHVVVLNSNCSAAGGCGATSPQVQWLQADLQAHPTQCTLAAWHHPLFNGTKNATIKTNSAFKPLWDVLYQRGAEIVLNGHVHHYERFAPIDALRRLGSGQRHPGVHRRDRRYREGRLVASSVGRSRPTAKTYGVLKLTLRCRELRLAVPPRCRRVVHRRRVGHLSLTGRRRRPATPAGRAARRAPARSTSVGRVLEVRELAGQVVVVGGHVEMAVPAEVEGDHLLLARLLAAPAPRRSRRGSRAQPRAPG